MTTIREFDRVARSQEEKGIEKYGQPLNPFDRYDWIEMALEECVDGFKYLLAEKVKRDTTIKKIEELLNLDIEGEKLRRLIQKELDKWKGDSGVGQ